MGDPLPFPDALRRANAGQRRVVGECLRAVAHGEIIPDWEFELLFDMPRERVQAVADAWPDVVPDAPDTCGAVLGALANLQGYPYDKRHFDWDDHISVPWDSLGKLFDYLAGGCV